MLNSNTEMFILYLRCSSLCVWALHTFSVRHFFGTDPYFHDFLGFDDLHVNSQFSGFMHIVH